MENKVLEVVVSISFMVIGAIIVVRYDPSHSSGPMLRPAWPDNGRWNSTWQSCQQLEVVMLVRYPVLKC